jgi:hypothetical protein
MVSCGIVGMPNVGKSTLFCALSKANAEVSSYPFCTIEANRAVVPVPDARLDRVGGIFEQETRIPATVEFIDIAGLVRGAHEGHGLGNQFLAHVRQVDAILHVVRCFDRPDVPHVESTVDGVRDAETVNLELALADLATVERRQQKAKRGMALDEIQLEQRTLGKLHEALSRGTAARKLSFDPEEFRVVQELFLLTMKPQLIIANVDEADVLSEGPRLMHIRDWARANGETVIPICAQLEQEVGELDVNDARAFVEEMGWPELGLERVVEASHRLLDLVTFFTAVGKECRAWTIPRGSTAQQAAGKIHTDMAKGFQKADVIAFEALDQVASWPAARDQGLIRSEGREYMVQDGDVVVFKFSA